MSANSSRFGLKLLVVVLILAGAVVGATAYFRPVAIVATIGKGNASNVVAASVIVEAGITSPVASEVDGILIESKLTLGGKVEADEVIARIAQGDIDLEVQRAQVEYDAAMTAQDVAKEMAKLSEETSKEQRAEAGRKKEEKSLSLAEFTARQRELDRATQQRKSELAEHERKVNSLKIALDAALLKQTKFTIKAPFDGVVTEVFVNRGELVSARQALANLIPHTRVVYAKIPEEDIAEVQVGQRAKVSLISDPSHDHDATISAKLPTSEPGTQRYLAILDLKVPAEKLSPGWTGDAAIYIDEHRDVVLVPRRAIRDRRVLAVENGRVRAREVDLGYTDLLSAEVKKGLQVGDQVIVERLDLFREGQRVRTQPAP